MNIYLVGGAVRDKLLDLPVTEKDWVVVGSTPEEMLQLGYKQVGKDFPVFLHPETNEEYALARTERKTGPGYKGFEVHADTDVSLEDDLQRRDLTINAMAMDENGKLIDLHNGKEDLVNCRLRHISPAFSEDPVRILRIARFAARFAQLGFKVTHETNALMRDMVKTGEVDALVPERAWSETEKSLATDNPTRFIEVLRGCGALAKIYPEIDALFGVPQPEKHHAEIDTGVHTLMVLDQATAITSNTRVRFAALTHDLGKGTTPAEEWPKHIGHEQSSVELVKLMCKRLRIPNDYRDLAMITARYHTHCHRAQELTPATLLKTLEGLDVFRKPERFEQFLMASTADARGRKGMENSNYPQADIFRKSFEACVAIDNRELSAAGLVGEEFAKELRKRRISAIKQLSF